MNVIFIFKNTQENEILRRTNTVKSRKQYTSMAKSPISSSFHSSYLLTMVRLVLNFHLRVLRSIVFKNYNVGKIKRHKNVFIMKKQSKLYFIS